MAKAVDPPQSRRSLSLQACSRPTIDSLLRQQKAVTVNVQQWVDGLQVIVSRHLSLLDAESCLDDTGNASCGLQLADIGLQAPECRVAGHAVKAYGVAQSLDFHRVAQIGACAVGFDLAEFVGEFPASRQAVFNHRLLGKALGAVSPVAAAVMVDVAALMTA